MVKMFKCWYSLAFWFILARENNGDIYSYKERDNNNLSGTLRPPIRFGAPSQLISAEHISLNFYASAEEGEILKTDLQHVLQNFIENLQRNLSTSPILSTVKATGKRESEVQKLFELADYFEYSSELAGSFAHAAEHFFECSKIESESLLRKLRQVPSAQRYLSNSVKMHLTDYFAEMEFFHVMFSEKIDEALEYIVDTLRSIRYGFIRYADIQRDILRTWNDKLGDEWCRNAYIDFIQLCSTVVFKCAATSELYIAYDVYGATETTTKFFMRQLEFRIQRLYNCFIFGGYTLRCQFLRYPEKDFQVLFAKLDDLQQFFDIKIKKGKVTIPSPRRRHSDENTFEPNKYKCLPPGFPLNQMTDSLRACFQLPNADAVTRTP